HGDLGARRADEGNVRGREPRGGERPDRRQGGGGRKAGRQDVAVCGRLDAHRDLRPVLALGFMPSVLTVHPAFGPKTLKEFVELARRQDIPYVSGGVGATGHLSMEYFDAFA